MEEGGAGVARKTATTEWERALTATEMLVPHLRTTLELDWSFPTLADVFATAARSLFEETLAQEVYLAACDNCAHDLRGDRAKRFLRSLTMVRQLADQHQALTYARMILVQEELLGRRVTFRNAEAYSHDGANRYLFTPLLERMFACKVEIDASDQIHPVSGAVRLYLDISFFHPFPDGNARAARLWLEYYLRRARLPTPPMGPLVHLPKIPGDRVRYLQFVRFLAQSVASLSMQGQPWPPITRITGR